MVAHMSIRSFWFLVGKMTFIQAQDASESNSARKSACGIELKSAWMLGDEQMMWVGMDKNPHTGYAKKVTCSDCIKILKENGL